MMQFPDWLTESYMPARPGERPDDADYHMVRILRKEQERRRILEQELPEDFSITDLQHDFIFRRIDRNLRYWPSYRSKSQTSSRNIRKVTQDIGMTPKETCCPVYARPTRKFQAEEQIVLEAYNVGETATSVKAETSRPRSDDPVLEDMSTSSDNHSQGEPLSHVETAGAQTEEYAHGTISLEAIKQLADAMIEELEREDEEEHNLSSNTNHVPGAQGQKDNRTQDNGEV